MPLDPWEVLLQKACDDAELAAMVADASTVSNEQIGFFTQQAIEKCFKAVLSLRGIRYRRTHDLGELMELLDEHSVIYPATLADSVSLTPFAAEMRYDYLPPEEEGTEPFDRAGALALVRAALQWANELIRGSKDDS